MQNLITQKTNIALHTFYRVMVKFYIWNDTVQKSYLYVGIIDVHLHQYFAFIQIGLDYCNVIVCS
jgi:hypothetical protein